MFFQQLQSWQPVSTTRWILWNPSLPNKFVSGDRQQNGNKPACNSRAWVLQGPPYPDTREQQLLWKLMLQQFQPQPERAAEMCCVYLSHEEPALAQHSSYLPPGTSHPMELISLCDSIWESQHQNPAPPSTPLTIGNSGSHLRQLLKPACYCLITAGSSVSIVLSCSFFRPKRSLPSTQNHKD